MSSARERHWAYALSPVRECTPLQSKMKGTCGDSTIATSTQVSWTRSRRVATAAYDLEEVWEEKLLYYEVALLSGHWLKRLTRCGAKSQRRRRCH
jgi:hypothetical protein